MSTATVEKQDWRAELNAKLEAMKPKPISAKNAALQAKMRETRDVHEMFALFDQMDRDTPEGFNLIVELDKDRRESGQRPLVDWDDPRNAGILE